MPVAPSALSCSLRPPHALTAWLVRALWPRPDANWNQTLRFALAHTRTCWRLRCGTTTWAAMTCMAKGVVDFKTAVDYGQHSGSFALTGKHGE